MKKRVFLYSLLLIICLWAIKESNLLPSQSSGKIPGSYKALELFSYIRAYPNKDIPSDGFSKAFAYHSASVSKMSTFKSDAQWEAMGPRNTAGRTLTVAVNPEDPEVIYAGSASGGLWRSRTMGLGDSWEYINTGFPVLGVSSIEFAPGDSATIYIGTGEVYNYSNTGTDGAFRSTRGSYGVGILKSTDGGQTWQKSLDWAYNQKHGVWMVKAAPSNHRTVYAATTDGIYKTVNGGGKWTQVSGLIMGTDIDVDPRDENFVVAAFGNFGTPGKGIYYTEDGGESWIPSSGITAGNFQGKILIARAPSNPDIMYASIGNGFGFNDGATWLYRSSDGGRSWTEKNTTDYSRWQGWFSHDVAVDPFNPDKIVCVGIDIWSSEDGGETLNRKSQGGVAFGTPSVTEPDGPPVYSHSDHHYVGFHPTIQNLVIMGNDGGVFLSYDGGESFRSANGGYQSTQFYNGFNVSPMDSSLALGGLQDNSTVIFRGTDAWQRDIGGDGSWTGINSNNDSIVYGSAQNLYLARSRDRGRSFNVINFPFAPGEAPLFISPYIVAPSNPDVLYAGGIYIYKSVDQGDNWEPANLGAPLNGDPVFAMDVFDSDHNIIYAATVGLNNSSAVFVSTDGGQSWTSGNTGLPNLVPNDVEIDPMDPSIAYVTFSGFGHDHLFRTDNYGQSWTSIGGDLPDAPGNAVAVDPENTAIIYYGNDIGVYYSKDSGETWTAMDNGLPPAVIAMDLKVSPTDRKLWVATHGNGAYRIDMVEGSVSTDNVSSFQAFAKIYPNPATDRITIETDGYSPDLAWELVGVGGQIVNRGSSRNVDISSLTNGLYYLRLMEGEKVFTHRIVKQ